jgi:hypothetical protein
LTQAQLIDILLHTSKIYPNLALFPSSPNVEIRVEDHYDGYETDPPQHYPKAGNGLAKTLPPESDAMPWLIDDNFNVFTHQVNYQTPVTASNGSVLPGVSAGIPPHVSERMLHTATAAPSPAANVLAVADVKMGGL